MISFYFAASVVKPNTSFIIDIALVFYK